VPTARFRLRRRGVATYWRAPDSIQPIEDAEIEEIVEVRYAVLEHEC
jgi:hypothetical protein